MRIFISQNKIKKTLIYRCLFKKYSIKFLNITLRSYRHEFKCTLGKYVIGKQEVQKSVVNSFSKKIVLGNSIISCLLHQSIVCFDLRKHSRTTKPSQAFSIITYISEEQEYMKEGHLSYLRI